MRLATIGKVGTVGVRTYGAGICCGGAWGSRDPPKLADKMAELARRLHEASNGADVVVTVRTLFEGEIKHYRLLNKYNAFLQLIEPEYMFGYHTSRLYLNS